MEENTGTHSSRNRAEFKVSADTLTKADKCQMNFSCLQGEKECLCEIEEGINNKIIFIKPSNSSLCNYSMSFGYSSTCNCPVRKEIYRIYRV